jgi:hypothetical protein
MGVRWWIAQYNADHHATYFLSGIRPIWWYDPDFILETIAMIAKQGLPAFASAGLYLACAGAVYLNSRHRPSAPAVLRNIFLFTVLGSAVYILLWFRMLREHDYYFICLLPIPVLLLLNGLRRAMHLYSEKRIVAALGLLFLLGVVHSHHILSKRLYLAFHPENHLTLPPDAFLPRYHLEYMGVHALARVLCPQDPSPNISLFALRRQGWTAYNFGDRINADTLRKYQTTLGMSHLALRDSTLYGPLYREFFPRKVCRIRGWYVYGE